MRDGEIVTIQFRNKNSCLCAKTSRNLCQQNVMVGVFLFESIHKLVSGKVNTLVLSVINCIVDHADGRQISDQFAAVGIEHN